MPVRRHYRRTIELDRNYLNAYLGLGVVLLRQGYKAALWAYQQVFAREPNNASAYELMGAMLIQQGRWRSRHSKVSNTGSKHQCAFAPGICLGEPGHHRWANDFEKAAQVDPRKSPLTDGRNSQSRMTLTALCKHQQTSLCNPIQQKRRQLSVIFC